MNPEETPWKSLAQSLKMAAAENDMEGQGEEMTPDFHVPFKKVSPSGEVEFVFPPGVSEIPLVTRAMGHRCLLELLCEGHTLDIEDNPGTSVFTIPLHFLCPEILCLDSKRAIVFLQNKEDQRETLLFHYHDVRCCILLYAWEMRDIKDLWTIYFNFVNRDGVILLSLITGNVSWYDGDGRDYSEIFSDVLASCRRLAGITGAPLHDLFNHPEGFVRIRE